MFAANGQLLCGGTAMVRDPGSISAGNCASGPPGYQIGLVEYPTSGAARTVAQYTANCTGQSALLPLWTSPSGSTQLGLLSLQNSVAGTSLTFGVFRDGKFSAVPAPAGLASDGDHAFLHRLVANAPRQRQFRAERPVSAVDRPVRWLVRCR